MYLLLSRNANRKYSVIQYPDEQRQSRSEVKEGICPTKKGQSSTRLNENRQNSVIQYPDDERQKSKSK